ncbi:hypothetical protein [Psychromicrobium xiongbiense]|nr:hypothetical protein [Psychromicrobium sp. YIM S02556]
MRADGGTATVPRTEPVLDSWESLEGSLRMSILFAGQPGQLSRFPL